MSSIDNEINAGAAREEIAHDSHDLDQRGGTPPELRECDVGRNDAHLGVGDDKGIGIRWTIEQVATPRQARVGRRKAYQQIASGQFGGSPWPTV